MALVPSATIRLLLPATLPWKPYSQWRANVGGLKNASNSLSYQLGLGDYEVRSWRGWHRHTTLVLAAQAFLVVLRSQVEPLPELSSPPLFLTPVEAGFLAAFKRTRVRHLRAHRELSVAARGLSSASVCPN